MEKILRIFGKEYGNINQAALLLGCFTLFSQILALFRDRSIAHFIGPSSSLDAYYAAFRVPDLIFICIASLASVMVLSPILMGLSNLFGTVTQLFHKFFIYSLSPIFYNLGIIAGVLFFYPIFGIYGLAIGVVLGALMHLGIQFYASRSCGFTLKFSPSVNFKDIKQAAAASFPRTLGLAFNNIALISIIALASFLKSGSISIFNFSFNLQSVPLNIIGISYAVAAPTED